MAKDKKKLVTSALPYANGPLHLGHILEFIQTDIWVRFQKQQGRSCYYICGDDAHGTPIMLKAQSLNTTPEELIKSCDAEHQKDIQDFEIGLDNFYSTHSKENEMLATDIYQKLHKNGDIITKSIKQAFDQQKRMFLPDRFIKGTCPKCKAPDQYGDNCESCGAAYSPLDLINPVSVLSGTPPIEKESIHYFFRLNNYKAFLQEWMTSKEEHLPSEIANKLQEWFSQDLQDWDISRDAPYFGFQIPDTQDKYFYVWLDAPIGYMASFKNLCQEHPELSLSSFKEYWHENEASNTELYHFIGKDIAYFHGLFWPATLKGSGYRTPTKIFVHGFLTINGQKMSKSRGTFITARTYLNHLDPEYLRYYFAAKLSSGVDDLDLNLEDFVQRINSDLVGKLVNIASRCASFINKHFQNQLVSPDLEIFDPFTSDTQKKTIRDYFEKREYAKAVKEIMSLADEANRYIDKNEPWKRIKINRDEVKKVCSTGINLFRILIVYLSPILPKLASRVEELLNLNKTDEKLRWEFKPLKEGHTIRTFEPLLKRLELANVEKLTESSDTTENNNNQSSPIEDPIRPIINYEDFDKVDLRVVKIIHAETVPEADKLLKLTLDLGHEKRQVFAGIKSAYTPEQLIGKFTIMVANLAPRKMRFGVSEGMVLAASKPNGTGIWILEPHDGAEAGMRVK